MHINVAFQKVVDLLGENIAQAYLSRFRCIEKIPGADRIFERLTFATHREKLLDYLKEVDYTLVFLGLGFQIEIEPHGKQGPDLRVTRDGYQALVEVTRFRPVNPGPPPEMDLSAEYGRKYGDPKRDTRKAMRKIYKKFPQVEVEKSIIAIWDDDEDMEEVEVKIAVRYLQKEETLPKSLLFVLYGSPWYQHLNCFPLTKISAPHYSLWQRELESFALKDIIQRALV